MEILNKPELLKLHFSNGMLLLPYYHCRLMARRKNIQSPDERYSFSSFRKVAMLLRGLRYISVKKRQILCLSNTRWERYENGKWQNILHGYYYDLFPNNFQLIERWDVSSRWRTFKSYDSLSVIDNYLTALSRMLASFMSTIRPIKRDDFNRFSDCFPFIDRKEIEYDDYFVRFYSFFIKLLLCLVKPKVLLLHCGSYGGGLGVICKVAKSKGVSVVDIQHGQIFNHKAYTAFDIEATSKEYMEYMPDYLYSFGEYWSKYVDWNYKIIAVGNPYLNECVKQTASTPLYGDYLVLSQPHEKSSQMPFIFELSKTFPTSKIVVRLHPDENVESYIVYFNNCPNIELSDSSVNLYCDMCRCRFVIGWCSTALYELMAFGRCPIIVRNDLSKGRFPSDLGIWIDTPEDLKGIKSDKIKIDTNGLWHQNFEISVRNHIEYLLKN